MPQPSWYYSKSNPTQPIKVGVVGSGLAGLLTAYSISTLQANMMFKSRDRTPIMLPRLEVHLFESSPKLGLSQASIQVSVSDDDKLREEDGILEHRASASDRRFWNIDSPMRAIQSGYYTHLTQLYKFLGISLTKTDFSYSFYEQYFSREAATSRAKLLYEGTDSFHIGHISKPSYITTWFSLDGISNLYSALYIGVAYVLLLIISALSYHARNKPSYNRDGTSLVPFLFSYTLYVLGVQCGLGSEAFKYLSVRDWTNRSTLPVGSKWSLRQTLKRRVLEPLFCSICSCSIGELDDYPVVDIFDFMFLTFGHSYYACSQGVKTVTKILTHSLEPENIHLGMDGTITNIVPISINQPQIQVVTRSQKQHAFDHLIFATQADQLKTLLSNMCETHPPENLVEEHERIELLSKFKYCKTLVVNHVDPSVLPADPRDWRDLNFTTSSRNKDGIYDGNQLIDATESAVKSQSLSIEGERGCSPAAGSSESLASSTSVDSAKRTLTCHKDHKSKCSTPHAVFDDQAYWMSTHIIHRSPTHLLLQTTNPTSPISQASTINRIWFNRVLVDADSRKAYHQLKNGPALGLHNIWFTGSWFSEGIPLLEGCVSSSELVVKRFVKHLIQDLPDQLEMKFVWEDST
ncbi:uncharacterized protein MELLADRAFT_113355 [Melampsora larici-populina 98AG31]|uniref:Amine oxidase domain-containing protein n=1 Tax=Melampsora larici-populina (strain 98AG31 / pathotype 3-4-7) TaxID=747676 RepID=F4S9L5_MELLP|nr:uncharacterized protein MELLADRAFT_113355 [Melampsora larici-populina 98AG31]EGF98680.1 hypothetical protein MELLADRAFT_113355 [Melampsora larici-populina 98AG31]